MVDNNFFFETPCGVHFSVVQLVYRSDFYDKLAEIHVKLTTKVDEKGFSLIPVKMYLSKGKIKIEIALAKGKKLYDKRDSITTKQFKKDKANLGL